GEVVVDRRRGHIGAPTHLLQRGALEAPVGAGIEGGIEKAGASRLAQGSGRPAPSSRFHLSTLTAGSLSDQMFIKGTAGAGTGDWWLVPAAGGWWSAGLVR